jgi:hypothetical protein
LSTHPTYALQGRIFMTHPTKAIFYTLVSDFANLSGEDALFSKKDVEACMDRIEVLDFDQTILVDGIQVRQTWKNVFKTAGAADGLKVVVTVPVHALPALVCGNRRALCGSSCVCACLKTVMNVRMAAAGFDFLTCCRSHLTGRGMCWELPCSWWK